MKAAPRSVLADLHVMPKSMPTTMCGFSAFSMSKVLIFAVS
jgi:hypothetical protein